MPFEYEQPVRIEETTAAGTLYYAAVPRYVGRAVEDLLAAAGHPYRENLAADLGLVVTHSEADYVRPMREGDELAVAVTPSFDDSAVRFDATGRRDGEETFAASETRVPVDLSTMERRPLPAALREGLEPYR